MDNPKGTPKEAGSAADGSPVTPRTGNETPERKNSGTRSSNGRARLAEVARAAKVTKGTASRILSRDETFVVRPETRERVLAIAAEFGYRPNALARALARTSAEAIALLAPSVANPAFAPIIRAAQRRAHELGYVLMTAEDPDDQAGDAAFARLVREGRIDGLIIASARPHHKLVEVLDDSGYWLPHVFLYRQVAGSGNNVSLDIRRPAVLAAEYLVSLGHRKIAHIAGPADNALWAKHATDFSDAARSRGSGVVVEAAGFSESAGGAAMEIALQRFPDLTAVYTSSLLQALGVLAALRESGKRVPDEVSVLAYDEVSIAAYTVPPLSTVSVPVELLGIAAVDAIVARLSGEEERDVNVDCEPRIVIRESTKRAPHARGTG